MGRVTKKKISLSIDVLCVGATSYDFVYKTDKITSIDDKFFAKEFISCGGGPASNAAVTVARLGLKSAFCGYLGNDLPGKLHFDELKSEKVNTDLILRGNEITPVSSVVVQSNGERLLINFGTSNKILKSNEINFTGLNPKVILFDGHQPEISEAILNYAVKNKILTVLDAGSVHKGTLSLYQKVDFLVCSKKFALEITGKKNINNALKILSKLNKNVLITLGGQGIIWETESGKGRLPAIKVKVVDTTGAGDVFHGAFVYCLAKNWNWESAVNFSNIAAGLSCRKLGARTSIPYINEIESYLKKKKI